MLDPNKVHFATPNSPTFGLFVEPGVLVRAEAGILSVTPEHAKIIEKMMVDGRGDITQNIRPLNLDAAEELVAKHRRETQPIASSGMSSTNPAANAVRLRNLRESHEFLQLSKEEQDKLIAEMTGQSDDISLDDPRESILGTQTPEPKMPEQAPYTPPEGAAGEGVQKKALVFGRPKS